MTYEFQLDREDGTWTAINPNGQQIDSGTLPLTNTDCQMAILEDKGVPNPVREAMQAVVSKDWETTES